MSRYGDSTDVPIERTRAELDALLSKHGASQRATYEDEDAGVAAIQFRMAGRMVRLEVKTRAAATFAPKTWSGISGCSEKAPNGAANRAAYLRKRADQDARGSWRRLLLICKAKLEMIADGGSTLEREFLADILLPDGRTVHQAFEPELADAYEHGRMPALLPAPK